MDMLMQMHFLKQKSNIGYRRWSSSVKRGNGMEKEQLAGIYREIADLLGIDNAIKMHQYFKGQQVSFPSRIYDLEYLEKNIKEEYEKGMSVRELSKKYEYTERRIRQFLKEEYER